ncbi:hypothetical protein U9M48_018983, partial [Paspalum notatum var. saurae]
MKHEVAEYVALCDICRRVKAEHQKPSGLLEPLKINSRVEVGGNWYGFYCRPATYSKFTKVAHFIPIKTTYTEAKLAELYMSRIVYLHGVHKKIVSGRGTQFTSHFWNHLHESMDTKSNFSSAYHPQTDGQTERTNQILEDMLRVCALQYETSWDKSLPYAEFSYNKSYQASVKMTPFQTLYARQCRMPLQWDQPVRSNFPFAIGDYVYLKVSSIRGLRRFKVKGKLAPRCIGPFKIVDRKGEDAYQLELPDRLAGVHDVFHVSQLKKCLRVPEEQLQMDDLNVQDDLIYTEYPVQILETAERVTRKKVIKMCKVKWSHHSAEEATWNERMLLEQIIGNSLLANPKIFGQDFFKV